MTRLLAVIATLWLITTASATEPARAPVVAIEHRDATVLYVRDFVGNYGQHAAAARALKADGLTWKLAADPIVGIYPDDPAAVGAANARWSLGLVVATQDAGESAADFAARVARLGFPLGEDRLRQLPAGAVAVIHTTVERMNEAGMAMLAWLPGSGYAQSGPTRTEYFEQGQGTTGHVQIVVPVNPRAAAAPD